MSLLYHAEPVKVKILPSMSELLISTLLSSFKPKILEELSTLFFC